MNSSQSKCNYQLISYQFSTTSIIPAVHGYYNVKSSAILGLLNFKVHFTQFSYFSCPYCFDIHRFDRYAAWHRCLTDLNCLLISQLLHHCQCSSAHPEPSRSQPNQDQTSSSSSLSSLLSFLPSLSSFHLRELYSTFANHLFCFGFFPPSCPSA